MSKLSYLALRRITRSDLILFTSPLLTCIYQKQLAWVLWVCRYIPAVCSEFRQDHHSIETCTSDPKCWEPSASPSWHLLLEMTSVTVCRLSSPERDWTLCLWIRVICRWNSGASCSPSGSGGNGALLHLFQLYKLLQFYKETVKIVFPYISDHCELLLGWPGAGKSTCDLMAGEELFSSEGWLAVSRVVTWRENAILERCSLWYLNRGHLALCCG